MSALVLYKYDLVVASPDPVNLKSTPSRLHYMVLNHIFTYGVGVMDSLPLLETVGL